MDCVYRSIRRFAVVCLVFCVTGCAAVCTDSPDEYGISDERDQYADPADFDAVYSLTTSSGWDSDTTTVLFDFKGDGFLLEPKTEETDDGPRWIRITTRSHLEEVMTDVWDARFLAITAQRCSNCKRGAAGAMFTRDYILFDFDEDSQTCLFRKSLGAAGKITTTDFGGKGSDGGGG